MKTLKKYKQEIRKLFLLSVDKEKDKWFYAAVGFYSPTYQNNTKLMIDLDKNILSLYDGNIYTPVLKYKWSFIPIDLKVWLYVNKLKKNIKRITENRKDAQQIEKLKFAFDSINKNFLKDIRKEKIDKINKNET